MNTLLIPYKDNKELIFDITEPNSALTGFPLIIIYADEYNHVKIPFLFREIAFVQDASELKHFTNYFLVFKHKLHERNETEILAYLKSTYYDLVNFNYISLTEKQTYHLK